MSMSAILDNILPAPPAPRVHLVTLGVSDVAAATRLYETIGLTKSSAAMNSLKPRLGYAVLRLQNLR